MVPEKSTTGTEEFDRKRKGQSRIITQSAGLRAAWETRTRTSVDEVRVGFAVVDESVRTLVGVPVREWVQARMVLASEGDELSAGMVESIFK